MVISPLSHCRTALMITDSQKKNENRRNREKKEERLDISISNHEILVTFKYFIIRPEVLILCHKIKRFSNL